MLNGENKNVRELGKTKAFSTAVNKHRNRLRDLLLMCVIFI